MYVKDTDIVCFGKTGLVVGQTVEETSSMLDKNQFKKIAKDKRVLFRVDYTNSKFETIVRHTIEHGFCHYVTGLELDPKNDHMHQRRSGFNHVLAKLCAENGIVVVFDLSIELTPLVLGRMRQNIRLCEKYGVDYFFASFAKKKSETFASSDRESLMRVLKV